MRKILFFLAFFLSLGQIVFASSIFTSDINGTLKQHFYPNETVYLAPSTTNITTNATNVTEYIVYDSPSWANQTILADVSGSGYKNLTTNSSGYLYTTTEIWSSSQRAGNYDVVIDVNNNGLFDTGIDVVFDLSPTGFLIVSLPVPTLSFAIGENNTGNHIYTIPSNNSDNVMMQVKITAGSFEDVKVNSLSLIANGTGDDVKGVSMIKLILDSNQNGQYDQGETFVGAGKYLHDNAVAQISLYDGYTIPSNNTVYFLLIYTMSNTSANGSTYFFQLTSVSGVGTDGVDAKVTSSPINSAIKTVFAAAVTTTTTTTSSNITTTTTQQNATTTTTTTSNQRFPSYYWIYIAVGVSVTVIIFFLVFWLRTSHVAQNEFKPPQ